MNPLVEEAAFTAQKLAALQAYPINTLEVEVSPDHRQPSMRGAIGMLVGLLHDGVEFMGQVKTPSETPGETTITRVPIGQIKPFLKQFAALCTPLEDGAVPAIRAAWLALGSPSSVDLARALAIRQPGKQKDYNAFSRIAVQMRGSGTGLWLTQTDEGEWVFDGFDDKTPALVGILAAYDYLRGLGFALPVNGRPLIEGRDYLPK